MCLSKSIEGLRIFSVSFRITDSLSVFGLSCFITRDCVILGNAWVKDDFCWSVFIQYSWNLPSQNMAVIASKLEPRRNKLVGGWESCIKWFFLAYLCCFFVPLLPHAASLSCSGKLKTLVSFFLEERHLPCEELVTFFFFFWVTPCYAQGLLLVLSQGIIPGMDQGTIWDVGDGNWIRHMPDQHHNSFPELSLYLFVHTIYLFLSLNLVQSLPCGFQEVTNSMKWFTPQSRWLGTGLQHLFQSAHQGLFLQILIHFKIWNLLSISRLLILCDGNWMRGLTSCREVGSAELQSLTSSCVLNLPAWGQSNSTADRARALYVAN